MEEILASVQVRRDTKANWETINPVLLEGEAAYEQDTDMFKIGDGVKHYSDLPYHNKVGPKGPQGEPGPTPQISMNVSTGNPGTSASVSVTGTAENPVINLTVPRGDTGKTGSTGPKGDTGNSGVYIGTSQPTDSNINVWIDSDGEPTEVIDDFAREAIGKLKDDLFELTMVTVKELISSNGFTNAFKSGTNTISGNVSQNSYVEFKQNPITFGSNVIGRKFRIVLDISHSYDGVKTFSPCSILNGAVNQWGLCPTISVNQNEHKHTEFDYIPNVNGNICIYCYGGGANVDITCKVYDITDIDNETIQFVDFDTIYTIRYVNALKSRYAEVSNVANAARSLVEQKLSVSCIGDSLTYGYGANHGSTDYPTVLANLCGKTVYNLGVSGEASNEILARQGGYPARVNPFVIPSDAATVEITFNDTVNIGGDSTPLLRKNSGSIVNPVIIDGIEGSISTSDGKYYFTRSNSGDVHNVTRPCPVVTKEMREHKDDIQVIFMGTNGGWLITANDAETRINKLTSQIDMMIDYNTSKKYVIVGMHYFYNWVLYNGLTKEMLENAMKLKYGNHYINLRKYMIEYGLADAGITPTEADTEAIANGEVPPSLLYSDGIHGNAKFYNILANLVNEKGKELGYW